MVATVTDAEKKAAMTARNAAICAYYAAGHTLRECASEFKLSRQRVYQVTTTGGVCKPYAKSNRTKFLGVNVSEETRDALASKAVEKGVSVSRFVSDALDQAVVE